MTDTISTENAPQIVHQTYFHCSGTSLAVGAIINPGNWGRMLRLYEVQPNAGLQTNVFREALMEQARLIYAPTKVSRLEAVYVLPSLADAVAFRDQYQPTNIIYEVQPTDPSAPPTIGDYAFAVAPYPQRYFNAMFDYARRYWVDPPHQVEMLFSCPMCIVAIANVP
jgi:hypothetical protein